MGDVFWVVEVVEWNLGFECGLLFFWQCFCYVGVDEVWCYVVYCDVVVVDFVCECMCYVCDVGFCGCVVDLIWIVG